MAEYKSAPPSSWQPESWRSKPIFQQPQYSNREDVTKVTESLAHLPPLVHPTEVEALRQQLQEVAEGKRFLLQGGDCAERFLDCSQKPIEAKLKILLQMSVVLTWGARIPTVRIARMAGQYAKPRSKDTEIVDGKEVPSFRGDNINGFEPDNRDPDPQRLLQAYFHSGATLNYVRALLRVGFADLRHAKHWNLDYVEDNTRRVGYEDMVDRILDSLDFMQICGAKQEHALQTVDMFTSHEGLVLEYESAMTRLYQNNWYNTSAHFLWIGDRTRQIDCAHVEYFRGLRNPIGVKVGPSMQPSELVELCQILNAQNEPGRLCLITRLGAQNVERYLPAFIDAIKEADLNVVWMCDPMHGNTHSSVAGLKTRSFDRILQELLDTFETHSNKGTILGGVHFELTGEHVTECVGGPENLGDHDLPHNYTTYCDPRLNYRQSMEISFRLAQLLNSSRPPNRSDSKVSI